jgi:hypothetical protein
VRVSTDLFLHNETFTEWVAYLRDLGDPPFDVSMPPKDALPALLRELAIPEDDIGRIIDSIPTREEQPEIWWFLDRCVYSLVQHMGQVDAPPTFAPLRDINDPDYRYFYVHVFLAAHGHVTAYHESRGIPKDVSVATLADLGRNVRVHRKRYGVGGLGVAFWLMRHFRGTIYQLGRLQFERARLGSRLVESITIGGTPTNERDLVLSLHIPDYMGPLSPEACDASIESAKTFFAEYFPTERYVAAVCHSWLLDPQLREYLPDSSNIIAFQDRFTLGEHQHDVDTSIVQFVFGPTPANLDELPQRSSLERAVVGHLKAGRHWKGRSGWFRF